MITYKGLDCVDHLFNKLKQLEKFIIDDIDKHREPMKLTEEEEYNF